MAFFSGIYIYSYSHNLFMHIFNKIDRLVVVYNRTLVINYGSFFTFWRNRKFDIKIQLNNEKKITLHVLCFLYWICNWNKTLNKRNIFSFTVFERKKLTFYFIAMIQRNDDSTQILISHFKKKHPYSSSTTLRLNILSEVDE